MRTTTSILAAVGALNWGLISLLNFNLVSFLFGVDTLLTNAVYLIVGVSGAALLVYTITSLASAPSNDMKRQPAGGIN
jgi:hypothetical protein